MKRLLLTISIILCFCIISTGSGCAPAAKAVKNIPKIKKPTRGGGGGHYHGNWGSQQEENQSQNYQPSGNNQVYTIPDGYGGYNVYDGQGQYQGNIR
ncbi:MAG: hypothetical protein LBB88_09210 [Planctomycetaceae bacterium]|jgi:hypothetical protein|nr:hypothetical protein [Planctomycetaceae bacterium]